MAEEDKWYKKNWVLYATLSVGLVLMLAALFNFSILPRGDLAKVLVAYLAGAISGAFAALKLS